MSPLAQLEPTLRGLLEASPDAIVIANGHGTIIAANPHAHGLFGYAERELLGHPVEVLVPTSLRGVHVGHRDGFVATPHRRPMGLGLLLGVRKDGIELPVEVSLCPLDTDGGPVVAAAIRDVSERVRIQRALEAANEELEAFSYSVSHDLRAPLRQVEGFARLLEERCAGSLDDTSRRHLDGLRVAVSHMDDLVDALLRLARVGRAAMREVRVPLDAVAKEAIEAASDVGDREVVWKVAPLPEVRGDPGLLAVVLANLVSNAVKYTRPRRPAVIEVGPPPAPVDATFMVRDNGVGFDTRRASKLFGPFQRFHSPEEFEGQGIGLATVRRIVRRHGGEVWAESEPGAGATFFVRLPEGGPGTPAAA